MHPSLKSLLIMFSMMCVLVVSGCRTTNSVPLSGGEEIAVHVSDPDDPCWSLTNRQRETLKQVGFTQVSMPFGVLLAADEDMPPAHVKQAAAILAEMMDQDMDGVVDDPRVAAVLARHETCWLAMPMDEEQWEESQLPRLERVLGYDIIIPEWWMDVRGSEPDERARAVMVEEIHHFMTQFGFSEVYPEIFGVDGWDSVIARETMRAQCDFWQHPENDCPGRPAEYGGDCSDPSCDVVEFYQQVVVLRAGMEPGWYGIGFPEDRVELESRLGREIKEAMDDPRYHQLDRPLQFDYPVR
ncbi:MAG: hypothetical protein CMJ40_06235 [Phycisphaerae bacterium]|nr:hypothetical protein [Phycisphaerae bacterium]